MDSNDLLPSEGTASNPPDPTASVEYTKVLHTAIQEKRVEDLKSSASKWKKKSKESKKAIV